MERHLQRAWPASYGDEPHRTLCHADLQRRRHAGQQPVRRDSITTYGYDAYRRLTLITRPGGSTVSFTYNLNDQLLTLTDERGETTTFTYDANGNLSRVTDALGNARNLTSDLMDRISTLTDPLAQAANLSYDAMGRVSLLTDRNGNSTALAYNSRGWLTGVTDPAGNTWATAYDDEGVPTSLTTPMGRITAVQTDKLGRVTAVTDPLGATASFVYDRLGRLTSATDRLGRTTTYTYDGAGRLTAVHAPGPISATYTRNGVGLITSIRDPGGNDWLFSYYNPRQMWRQTDPLGRRLTYMYDDRGRLQRIAYPTAGETATFTYDNASNVTQVAHSTGPTRTFTYDDVGRLLTANNIAFTYDARGDVINSQDGAASFGATYDNGRRLRTVTYDGLATVTYTYDVRDLLVRVEDSISGAWMTFTYDADARLTSVQRSNGVSTTYTYDAAGRVIGIQDATAAQSADGWETGGVLSTLADQQYALNAEGEIIQVARTLPYDPDCTVAPLTLSYDAASQINSAGYSYDTRGRQTAAPGRTFAYDGASRLTSVISGSLTANLTYNGLDDLRTRSVGSSTTSYFHNYALGLAPIVAEATGPLTGEWANGETGILPGADMMVYETEESLRGDLTGLPDLWGLQAVTYKRFYVYTPGGSLLYSIDRPTNQVRFYHFDRTGSTLFLTNAAGSVSDAYAYDPYGRLLGQTGSSDQPFTYVGQYGVRREPVGNLYDMRARAYDPLTTRFLTRDPVWPNTRDPESLNPYQYAAQDPLRHIDPQGTQIWMSDDQAASFFIGVQQLLFLLEAMATPENLPLRDSIGVDMFVRNLLSYEKYNAWWVNQPGCPHMAITPDINEWNEQYNKRVAANLDMLMDDPPKRAPKPVKMAITPDINQWTMLYLFRNQNQVTYTPDIAQWTQDWEKRTGVARWRTPLANDPPMSDEEREQRVGAILARGWAAGGTGREAAGKPPRNLMQPLPPEDHPMNNPLSDDPVLMSGPPPTGRLSAQPLAPLGPEDDPWYNPGGGF